jgi:uncharacterized Zn finger protein (UPF0148 family)
MFQCPNCKMPMCTTAYDEIVYCPCCLTQMSKAMVRIIKRQREESQNDYMPKLFELYGYD